MSLLAIAEAVQQSGFGQWAGGSPLAYPLANTLHLLGLVLLVGGIGLLDLRVAGAFRALPLAPLARYMTPLALAGLAILLPTGAILFAADAVALAQSDMFLRKLVLIAIALVNALAFRWLWQSRFEAGVVPAGAKLMALASLALWLAVATLGRLIAYA